MATVTRQQNRTQTSRFLSLASERLRRASLAAYLISSSMAGPAFSSLSFADEAPILLSSRSVVHAVADEATNRNGEVAQVVGKQMEARRSTPSRALFFGEKVQPRQTQAAASTARPSAGQPVHADPNRSYVSPAAGVLDGLFGGSTPKKAKKEHEDGRIATPLPPPDPSTVDWNGITFHQPKASTPPDPKAAAPIRDYQSGASQRQAPTQRQTTAPVPVASANLRRAAGTTTTQGQPVSSTNRTLNRSIPPVPLSPAKPVPRLTQTSPTTSAPSVSALSASASSAASTPSYNSELSSSDSTRRSGRSVINALDPESMVMPSNDMTEVPSETASLTEPLSAPSVPRRELMPLETSASSMAKVSRPEVESLPQLPKTTAVVAKMAPAVKAEPETVDSDIPPVASPSQSLEDSWNTVGSGVNKPVDTSKIAATPVSKPSNAVTSPVVSPLAKPVASPAIEAPLALAPPTAQPKIPATMPTTAPTPIAPTAEVTEAAKTAPSQSFGPSVESERTLRDALTTSRENNPGSRLSTTASPLASKLESNAKQLGMSELPGVRVVTEGPSDIMIREITQYEVRVENRGSFDANGIIVRSSLPPWAEVQSNNASIGTVKTIDQSGQAQLQWTIDKLAAGVVERLFIRVKAIKSGTFDVATDWTIMPQKHVAQVTVREPKLFVIIDGPDEIVYGRSEKYRVRVMNPGDGQASNVVFTLSPDSKNPQSQKIGEIPAGKEAEFEIELTARELGELKISGMATADREVKTTVNKSIRIASAALEAELTGPPLKYQNTNANYHLLLTNTGKAVCESMEAELRLPMGVTYVSGLPQATVQGDRLVWKIDAIQAGAVREYDLVCRMDRTGDMVIGFNCNGSASGRASVSIETRVEAIADLVLSISDPIAPAPVNTDVVYEMTILNRGSKAAEDVQIIAQFSTGIEPLRVEGHSGEISTGQALFNPISRIEPGTTTRLKVIAKADRAGDHRFRAEVRYGDTSHVAEEATMYMEAPAERISRRSTNK